MSHDDKPPKAVALDIAQAYREAATAKRWRKERLTDRWRLAQAAATNHNLLHGPSVLKHATNLTNIGRRSVVKGKKNA